MATTQMPENPLDTLQAMVTLVLVQTGQIFRDPSKRDAYNLHHTNVQMNQAIPIALNRFNNALDEIETEITRAKEILSRDLARRRAKKSITLVSTEATPGKSGSSAVIPENPNPGSAAQSKTASHDTPMTDAPTSQNVKGTTPSKGQNSLNVLEVSDLNRTKHLGTSKSESLVVGDPATSERIPTEDTPATASLNKMNFDSMFPDGAGEDGTGDLTFDLDFSTDTAGDQNMLGEDFALAGNIQSTAPPVTGLPADTTNDDFSSLLPDLAEYGTLNDADLSMLDMPAVTNSAGEAGQPQTAKDGTALLDNAGDPNNLLPSDSNFDDLFMDSTGFDMGAGDGTGTLGEGGELDDAFFGLGDT